MIRLERLHPSEFDLLEAVGDGYKPNPDRSVVVVARNDTKIIGRSFILAPAHVEGTFIEPAWRGGTLLKQLIQAVEVEAKAEGIEQLLAYSESDAVDDYLARLGYMRKHLSVWEKRLACR